jgi:Ser/Thr protein kinase RdoA (MazF antagonist)
MDDDPNLCGIEQRIFASVRRESIDRWLEAYVARRLGRQLESVLFRSGRVGAVYGLRLTDGVDIVVKVHRPHERSVEDEAERLEAAVGCQDMLASAGYPCPRPLDGPDVDGPLIAVTEELIPDGDVGDGHNELHRRAMVESLAAQIDLLRGQAAEPLHRHRPAWAMFDDGPWPTPHDPIFNFDLTLPEFQWLDLLAAEASARLRDPSGDVVVGHADWTCGNVRFAGDRITASYDWDSLVEHREPVIVGLAAASHTEGSTSGRNAPEPPEVKQFLDMYERERFGAFTRDERAVASAAATWVLAYNARCGVALLQLGFEQRLHSPLGTLSRHRVDYLAP